MVERETILMELNEQERQLVEILREWDHLGDNRLIIERHGVWDVALQRQGAGVRVIRGTGSTFAEAWDGDGLGPDRLTGEFGGTRLNDAKGRAELPFRPFLENIKLTATAIRR